jgi:hypothetical protein
MHRIAVALLLALSMLQAQQPRLVRGIVVDENGRPLVDVAIASFGAMEPFVTAELLARPVGFTDRDGRFEFVGPAAELLDVLLLVGPDRVHVACPAANAIMQPIVLPKGRTMTGRVRDADGNGIEGARVEIYDWLATAPFLDGNARAGFPMPRTAVRTDKAGQFVVRGTCDTALLVLISGDGIEPVVLPAIAVGDPLDVTVQRFTPVIATVLTPDGQPAAGVDVHWRASRPAPFLWRSWITKADASGRARQPTRTATHVNASWRNGAAMLRANEAELRGDSAAIELKLTGRAGATPADRIVSVRARDADSKPVSDFHAAAILCVPNQFAGTNVVTCLGPAAKAMAEATAGVATIRPLDFHGERLFAIVDAPGFALAATDLESSGEIVVKLDKGGQVTGTVVDQKSGAPIAGARVWTLPRLDESSVAMYRALGIDKLDPHLRVATTAVDGTFLLPNEPTGPRHLL